MTNTSAKDLDAALFNTSSAPLDWAEDGLSPTGSMTSPLFPPTAIESTPKHQVEAKKLAKQNTARSEPERPSVHLTAKTHRDHQETNMSPYKKQGQPAPARSKAHATTPRERRQGQQGLGIVGAAQASEGSQHKQQTVTGRGRSVSYSRGSQKDTSTNGQHRANLRTQQIDSPTVSSLARRRRNTRADAADRWQHDKFNPNQGSPRASGRSHNGRAGKLDTLSRAKHESSANGSSNGTAMPRTRTSRTVSMSSVPRKDVPSWATRQPPAQSDNSKKHISIKSTAPSSLNVTKQTNARAPNNLGILSQKTSVVEPRGRDQGSKRTVEMAKSTSTNSEAKTSDQLSPRYGPSENVDVGTVTRRHSITSRVLTAIDQLHFGQSSNFSSNDSSSSSTPKMSKSQTSSGVPVAIKEEEKEEEPSAKQEWEREWEEFCNSGGLERPLEELSDDNLKQSSRKNSSVAIHQDTEKCQRPFENAPQSNELPLNGMSDGGDMGALVLENHTVPRPRVASSLTIAEKAALCGQGHMHVDSSQTLETSRLGYDIHDPIRGRHLFSITLAVSPTQHSPIHVYSNDDLGVIAQEFDSACGYVPGRADSLKILLEQQRAAVLGIETWFV